MRTARLAALMLVAACGSEPEMDWNPEVVRAVAERSAEGLGGDGLVVWRRVLLDDAHASGPALPWGAHQALITGGFVVVDSGATRPDTTVLGFRTIRRSGDGFLVETAQQSPDGRARWTRWTVHCSPECLVTDSTPLEAGRL